MLSLTPRCTRLDSRWQRHLFGSSQNASFRVKNCNFAKSLIVADKVPAR